MPLSPQMKKTISGKRQKPMLIYIIYIYMYKYNDYIYIIKTRTAQLLMRWYLS